MNESIGWNSLVLWGVGGSALLVLASKARARSVIVDTAVVAEPPVFCTTTAVTSRPRRGVVFTNQACRSRTGRPIGRWY